MKVYSQFLFQRLIVTVDKGDKLKTFLTSNCHFPLALFESSLVLRLSHEFSLGNALWSPEIAAFSRLRRAVWYVLECGTLLSQIL